jgi:ribonuclease HI
MSGSGPDLAAGKKISDAEICRRLNTLVRADQLGLEEPEWRAFCTRVEQSLSSALTAGEKQYRINIDGAARGNPGPAAVGLVIADSSGKTVHEFGQCIGHATNNVAEYHALLHALDQALELGAESIQVRSDSELLVRQMNGLYRVKHEQLLPLFLAAREKCRNFASVEFIHLPRSQNRRADQLANMALDAPAPEA